MSRSPKGHLVSPGRQAGSARQDPLGLPGRSEVGAALHSPRGAAPTRVSAADFLPSRRTALPPVAVVAAAALTHFEGQAAFRILSTGEAGMLLHLRRGSRLYGPEHRP
jgi:hypothetical protein